MRFRLALRPRWPLLSLRIMRFGSGQCASVIGVALVLLSSSWEKHHLGEITEVQKEHIDPAKAAPQHQAKPAETDSESR